MPAHPLAAGVYQHEDGELRLSPQQIEHVAGKGQRAVDAEHAAVDNADDGDWLRPADCARTQQQPIAGVHGMRGREQGTKISSRVIGALPLAPGLIEKDLDREARHLLWVRKAERLPDLHAVPRRAETLKARGEAPLLGFHNHRGDGCRFSKSRDRSGPESRDVILHKAVGPAHEIAVLAAHGPPDEGAIA